VAAAYGEPFGGARLGLAALLGATLHREYQERAVATDPTFEVELGLQERFSHRGTTILLRGRADGVRVTTDGFTVEECKTRPAPGAVIPDAWFLQAALYARMLARARGAPCRAELVLLGGPEPIRHPVTLGATARDEALVRGLDRCLETLEADARQRETWRELAPRVHFPFAVRRPGQTQIEAAVEKALDAGGQLLVEAGTGTGKTAALLTPALRHALASGRRLVVLTASTLQQHLAIETLARLSPGAGPLVARLRARKRLCEAEATACARCGPAPPPLEPTLASHCFDAHGIALPERARLLADAAGVCPYALLRACTERALVTVCDYNYAIDPAVALPSLRAPETLRDTVLLVDEAHQLPARARDANTLHLDGARVRAAIEAAAMGTTATHRAFRTACEALYALIEATVGEAGALVDGAWVPFALPHDALAAIGGELRRLALEATVALEGTPPGPAFAALFELDAAVATLCDADADDAAFVTGVGQTRGTPWLERFCRDPAPRLRRVFGACHAVIGCSATLSPAEWFEAELGLDAARTSHERIAPPDRRAQRVVVIDATVTTLEKQRARQLPKLAKRLTALADAVPANCLVLMPSFDMVAAIRDLLPERSRALRVQRPDEGEAARRAHVDALRTRDDVLLLAVAGGGLAEGVDYAGARLGAVAVVGPCLPAVDAHRELLRAHFDEHFDRGFELAYAVPGMIRVIQSAGRLLRGEDDRGVIALFDRRFLREPYVSLLPEEWLDGRPPEERVGDPAEVARAFFAS